MAPKRIKSALKPVSPAKSPSTVLLSPPLAPHDSRSIRTGSTTYSSFREASGNGQSGVKEVNLSMVDFFDVDSSVGWTSIGYDVASLPGVDVQSSVRLRHCKVSVLEGSILSGVVDSSVGILAGVKVSSGGFTAEPTLASASQTLVLPSSVPKWRTVLEAPLAQLAEQGFQSSLSSGTTEVARLTVIDPDTGSLLGDVLVQVRVELSYSASFLLSADALVLQGSTPNVLGPPTGTPVTSGVFPRVTGMSNRV